MIEVESKVRLTRDEEKRLLRELPERFGRPVKLFRYRDDYFAFKADGITLRLREEKRGEGILTLKLKSRKKGVERNRETEQKVVNPSRLRKVFADAGQKPVAIKYKSGVRFTSGGLTVELVKVRGLGPFLEIEMLLDRPARIPAAKRKIRETFLSFGLTEDRFEKQYYLELLRNRQ
jgi:predicted adenylyl cyclase CyaB